MRRKIVLVLVLFCLLIPQMTIAAAFDEHRATAFMNITFECGCKTTGTGAMVGRRGLITAGHNLFCQFHGRKLKKVSFLFGAKSTSSGAYRYNGGYKFWAYDTFQNGYDSRYDIGYVVFDKAVGNSTGWFACRAGSDSYLNEEFSNVLNYSVKGKPENYFVVQYVANSQEIYFDGFIGYEAGEGGPVYFTHEGLEYPEVVAVYTHFDPSGNSVARRITNNIIEDMRADGAFD